MMRSPKPDFVNGRRVAQVTCSDMDTVFGRCELVSGHDSMHLKTHPDNPNMKAEWTDERDCYITMRLGDRS